MSSWMNLISMVVVMISRLRKFLFNMYIHHDSSMTLALQLKKDERKEENNDMKKGENNALDLYVKRWPNTKQKKVQQLKCSSKWQRSKDDEELISQPHPHHIQSPI